MADIAGTATDAEWFLATSHCGHCGNPGDYCTCGPRDPCACRDLHTMGSARLPGALNAFTDTVPAEVGDGQGELFA